MRVTIVAAGKVRERHVRTALDDYLARARRYLPVDEVEIKTGPREGRELAAAVPRGHELWALDAAGLMPTSDELARWIEERMGAGCRGVTFVLGGAEGLPPELLARADRTVSLTRLTLPHRLARLLLAEQLYRALTIIRGEPYSR